jgi:hypothetical protein
MSDQQYDDNNKGAVWNIRAHGGPAKVHGNEYRAALVETRAENAKAPVAMLFLWNRQKHYMAAMFAPDKPAKYVLSGKCDDLGVRAFVFSCDNLSPNSPVYRFSFLDLDDQRPAKEQQREAETPQNIDDTPF